MTALRVTWVLVSVCWLVTSARAGEYPVFRQISMLDGLPDPRVEAIVQDRFGYVWIGTQAGLVRHEGDQLYLLPRNAAAPGALPGQNIMALHAHADGMVWASIEDQGLVEIGPDLAIHDRIEPRSQGGILPDMDIWSMTEDCQGRLWMAFARGGVAVFDPEQRDLDIFDQNEEFGLSPRGFQTHLMTDRRCRIWLIQTSRVSVLDPSDDAQTFTPVLNSSGSGNSMDIFLHGWVSPEDAIFISRGRDLVQLTEIADAPIDFAADILHTAQGLITGIGRFADGRMFLTSPVGLEVVDREGQTSELITPKPGLPFSLPSANLKGAHLLDSEGGLWLAVDREGLAYLPPDHAAFSRWPDPRSDSPAARERIRSIYPAGSENVFWVTSDRDVFQLDVTHGERASIRDAYPLLSYYLDQPLSPPAMLQTDNGLLLLASQGLLYLRNGESDFEFLIRPDEVRPDSMRRMFLSDSGTVWITMSSGRLRSIDPETATVEHYGPDRAAPHHWSETHSVIVASGPQSHVWAAGHSRIYRQDRQLGFVQKAAVDSGPIRALVWDEGRLWVGTDTSLYQFRWTGDELAVNGLHDISELTERTTLTNLLLSPARDDALWLILRSGVARLDLSADHVRSFDRADGLALSEFSPEAATVLNDGQLLLGGTQGLVTIDPRRLRSGAIEPPVYLRAISAGGRRVPLTPGPRSALALDWDQNSVRFEFSALTYVAPEQVQYRVRLEGWDEDWLALGRQSSLYYSNLRPGQYR